MTDLVGGSSTSAHLDGALDALSENKVLSDMPPICIKYPGWSLFLLSVISLYLELLLIRWIGTEIRIFAYLQNSILVVCILGLGFGSMTSQANISLRSLLFHLGLLVGLLSIPAVRAWLNDTGEKLGAAGDFLIWNHLVSRDGRETLWFLLQGLAMTYLLLYATCRVFVPLGRMIGRLINDHPQTVRAYSVNIAGSLIGIWLFVALSAAGAWPFVWVLVLALFLFWFSKAGLNNWLRHVVSLTVIVSIAWWGQIQQEKAETHWSPYQKLSMREPTNDEPIPGLHIIEVNNVGYQGIVDTRVDAPAGNHAMSIARGLPPPHFGIGQYDLPTLVHPSPRRLLIVGAGPGNDAAGGVRGGADHITAVEIDPVIVQLGRMHHPEKPYSSPKVHVVVDDARAFLRCTDRFDVISFGLLDAHTQNTLTNGRLDHFVYTRESISQARRLLAPGGVILLSFEPQRPFIADRIARTLFEVFGDEVLIFRMPRSTVGWGGVMFIAGDLGAVQGQMDRNASLREYIRDCQARHPVSLAKITPVTTDDWPYLYVKAPGIPVLFYLLAALMALLTWHMRRALRVSLTAHRWLAEHTHFFALGAGFILLEVHNISRLAVVLGASWLVNAVVISGILVMILLANAFELRWPRARTSWAYVGLVASCALLYFVDYTVLFHLGIVPRILTAGLLTVLPVFFSGIIFIRSFSRTRTKDSALGANLFGSVLGSILQAISMLLGLKFLLVIVLAAYFLAACSYYSSTLSGAVDIRS